MAIRSDQLLFSGYILFSGPGQEMRNQTLCLCHVSLIPVCDVDMCLQPVLLIHTHHVCLDRLSGPQDVTSRSVRSPSRRLADGTMSLYDDIDSGQKSDRVPGWGSSNMKLLQSQLKLRKAAVSQPRRDLSRRGNVLAPVIDLKGKRDDDDSPSAAAAATAVLTMPGVSLRMDGGGSGMASRHL